MRKYPSLDDQIKEFGVYWLFCGKLEKIPITSTYSYSHWLMELHHYIKEQEYYRYKKRYKGEQKLILLPKQLHKDLHSAMSDERFAEKWKVDRDLLLYRHRKAY